VTEAPEVGHALYYPGQGPQTSARDIGDSAVLELCGLGAAAAAGSPAVAQLLGGQMRAAAELTDRLAAVCAGRSSRFKIPVLDNAGTPLGVDVRKVVELGITPAVTTGILHRSDGTGQVGAGVAEAPLGCFADALADLDQRLNVAEVAGPGSAAAPTRTGGWAGAAGQLSSARAVGEFPEDVEVAVVPGSVLESGAVEAESRRWREQRRLSRAVTAGPYGPGYRGAYGPGYQEGLAPGLAHGRLDEARTHTSEAAGTERRRPRPERLWLRVNRRVASVSLSVAAGVSTIDF
jgi:hypothetical protein